MTQLRFKVKKDDFVEVITGKNKGKRGKVLKVFLSEARVLVEGVNVVTRFLKATQQNPNGPVSKTLPIHISNVAVVDPSTDKPGKIAIQINENGTKTRVFKKSAQAVR